MAALDGLVVTTALPALRVSLDASLSELEWTVNSYTLAFACLILFGAALGDRFGRRRMYALGLSIFTVFSALAAMSPNVEALIAARTGQGIGAALVMPLTLTLISDAFPAEKRGAALGLWGGVAGVAVAFGPVVGGAVVQGLSWHWIFWLNVPVGLALVPLSLRFLTESYGPHPYLDFGGLLLSSAGLFGLTWGLVKVSDFGWGDTQVLVSLAAGLVLIGAFLAWEARTRLPMLRLVMFRSRAFTTGTLVNFFMFAALFGALFLMAQFLITGLGKEPLRAGVELLPWTAASIFLAPAAGVLADRWGNRPFMALGLALQGVGLFWISRIAEPGMDYPVLGVALLVSGIGIALVFPTVANTIVNAVGPTDIGIASGTGTAMQQVGGVFGVALTASVFAQGEGFSSPQGFVDSFSDALMVSVALSAVGVVVALLSPGRDAARADVVPAVDVVPGTAKLTGSRSPVG
jgi:EmrB/QacA subfamily drug resistance transporter